jgi:endonuclease-3
LACDAAQTKRRLLREVHRRLVADLGPRPHEVNRSAIESLVATILSQNTSRANSTAGLRQLKREFPSWSAVADAPVADIERCIRVSGLSRVKAPRIKRLLGSLRERAGGRAPSLAFLARRGDREAYEFLLGLDGLGPKSAACVLLFGLGRQVFPVDTHIRRIAIRLGLLAEGISAERAQEVLEPAIRPADRYEMHVLLIDLGRRICRARTPNCPFCPLRDLCQTGKESSNPD